MTSLDPARLNRPVPRYTSYPTAPHFHAGVGARDYRRWLTELDSSEPLSIYLHIPFCQKLCWYCGCHTKIVARYEPVAAYVEALAREIDLIAGLMPRRFRVAHLHWGGGTPTILTPADFTGLMDRLRQRFDIAEDAEIAVELDPRCLDEARARTLAATGVTRASVGIQDFDADVQKAINRWQPYDVTAGAVGRLRGAGIDQISFDLMYGLPRQTVDTVLAASEIAVALEPQRLALFGYAHVPWMKPHQRRLDGQQLPDMAERQAQAAAAAEHLQRCGYRWIGLDHFARPDDALAQAASAGRLRRNFQGYTSDACHVLLGLGCSAIGALPQGYVQNATDLRSWRRMIETGVPATSRGFHLNDIDRLRGHVIERLMCDLAVDLEAATLRYGFRPSVFEPEERELRRLEAEGLVTVEGRKIALTREGRPLMRIVAATFDTYLNNGAGRHVAAV
jgi:oxygen-independent coproporphyrinogen III oxidase